MNIARIAFVKRYLFASFIPIGGIRKLPAAVRLAGLRITTIVLFAAPIFCSAPPTSRAAIDLVQFTTGQFGAFYAAAGKPKDSALVLIHGGNGNFYGWGPFPLRLAAAGFPVLTINTRFHDTTLATQGADPIESEVLDIAAGIVYLRKERGVKRVVLCGGSLGAPRAVFYQFQAQLSRNSPERAEVLQSEELPLADGVIAFSSVRDTVTSFIRRLDPCMAKFGRRCRELNLLARGPPFRDSGYLRKLRTTQREIYADILAYVRKRLSTLGGDPDRNCLAKLVAWG